MPRLQSFSTFPLSIRKCLPKSKTSKSSLRSQGGKMPNVRTRSRRASLHCFFCFDFLFSFKTTANFFRYLAARVKKSSKSKNIKFKIRCRRFLYTLVLKDSDKADKLKQSLPPGMVHLFPLPSISILLLCGERRTQKYGETEETWIAEIVCFLLLIHVTAVARVCFDAL